MKCIYCSHDADYRKRQANHGRCFNCRRQYAFEPKNRSPKITDPLFQDVIQKISDGDQLFFTDRQLWYKLKRNKRFFFQNISCTGCLVILGAPMLLFFLLSVTENPFLSLLVAGVVGLVGWLLRLSESSTPPKMETLPLSFSDFQEQYLSRWIEVHGKPKMLWSPPNKSMPPASPDLQTYSFDHVLVTESSTMAQLLVANNFHFEKKCAVLSLDGYPFGIADTILKMLRHNPQLIVFALHDASIKGCQTPFILRQQKWFPDQNIKIVDLGIFPRHAQKRNILPLITVAKPVPSEIQSLLKPEEVTWLAEGQMAELEAFSSKRLMRSISRGMAFTKKLLEEHTTSGLPLPIIAGWAIISFDKELFDEERKKIEDDVWNDDWDELWDDGWG